MRKGLFKILITGGAGFIGSAFVRLLAKKEASLNRCFSKIVIVDKLTYAGDLKRISEAKTQFIKFYKNDICNKKTIKDIFKHERPDIVVNFAAETHVDRSILESSEFLRTNIAGTQVMLEASKEYGVSRFVHISTDEVYGDIEKGKFTESTPLNPSSPYSASKAGADLLVKSYIRTYKFPAIIVRPSNNYGPWQYPEKLIPVIIYKALKNERVPVYAKGSNMREWLYVDDCVFAVIMTIERGVVGQTYNIGSGIEKTNIEVVKRILDLLGRRYSLIQFVPDRAGHDLRYSLDCSKAQNDLGWEAKVNFDEGIERTVSWYKNNYVWLEEKVKRLKEYWKKVYK